MGIHTHIYTHKHISIYIVWRFSGFSFSLCGNNVLLYFSASKHKQNNVAGASVRQK